VEVCVLFFFSRLLVHFLFCVVRGNPGMQSRGRWSFFLGNILIRVEIEDGGRKAKVENGWLGKEVAWVSFRLGSKRQHSRQPQNKNIVTLSFFKLIL